MRSLPALIGAATALTIAVVLVRPAPVPAAGQDAGGSARAAARTAWGEPDLQGIWTINYETPLERPERYAGRELFTEEERAEIDKERARILGLDRRRDPKGSEQDVGGAYNQTIFLTHRHIGPRTSLITDPPDGKLPPLTPEAQQRRDEARAFHMALLQHTDACKDKRPRCPPYGPPSPRRLEAPPHYLTRAINRADGPEDRSLSERCLAGRLPDFGSSTGFFMQVIQSPGTMSLFYDTGQGQGWQRVVPVTDRPHLPPQVRQWWGDSRGRWEGDTLVVDVTNFGPKTDFYGSRQNLHLVERFTRVDAETISYSATMDDSTTWTKPWTVVFELNRQNDQANRIYKEPRCHEGNHGLPALLAGARADDRAFARGRGPHPATMCTAGAAAECGGFGGGFAESGDEVDPFDQIADRPSPVGVDAPLQVRRRLRGLPHQAPTLGQSRHITPAAHDARRPGRLTGRSASSCRPSPARGRAPRRGCSSTRNFPRGTPTRRSGSLSRSASSTAARSSTAA